MLCPSYKCQGLIYKAYIKDLDQYVYLCDDCEALWEDKKRLFNGVVDNVLTFLKKHNLEYIKTEIEDLGYDWDKSGIGPDIVLCPFCEGKGIVYRVKIGTLGIYAYYCHNCKALWHEGQKIDKDTKETLLGFLETKGLSYLTARLSEFAYDWSKQEKKS